MTAVSRPSSTRRSGRCAAQAARRTRKTVATARRTRQSV